MARKPGMGRQKLPMAKIHDRSRRDVTFSKRRAGLFKKAHELSILCGAEVGLIVFSPAGKVFSYGNPDVETITNRLMNGGGGGGGWDLGGGVGGGDRGGGVAAHLNAHLAQLQEQLAAEKKRGEELDKMHRAFVAEHGRCWWRDENPPESITLPELERLKEALEDLKRHAAEQAQKLVMEQAAAAAANSPFLYGNYAAGPSSMNPNVGGPLPPYVNNYNPYAAGPSSANPNVGSPLPPYGNNYNPYAAGPSSAFPSTGGPNPNYADRPSSANPYLYGGSGGSGYGPQGPF